MADLETDVLVIGLGPAGAAAAITAADRGAHVTVIEKTNATGGNCRYSGGFIWDVDGPDALAHLEALCFGKTDTAVLAAYLDGLHDVAAWIEGLGGATLPFTPPQGSRELPAWPRFPGADRVSYRLAGSQTGGPGGRELWRVLGENVERRVAHVLLEARATSLLVGHDGRVGGCTVELRAGELAVHARHATILTCGGFEWDTFMREAYLEPPLVPVGHHGNTGDGIRLAVQVNAALWHMSAFFGWFAFATGYDAAFPLDFHGPSFVWVDADGRRFADETGYEVHDRVRAVSTYLPRRANYPHLPLYAIFDERTRLAGPLNGVVGTPNDYAWSADNGRSSGAGGSSAGQASASSPLRSASTARRCRRRSSPTTPRPRRAATQSTDARPRRSCHSTWTACTRSGCCPESRRRRAGPGGTHARASCERTASLSRACSRPAAAARSGGTSRSSAAG